MLLVVEVAVGSAARAAALELPVREVVARSARTVPAGASESEAALALQILALSACEEASESGPDSESVPESEHVPAPEPGWKAQAQHHSALEPSVDSSHNSQKAAQIETAPATPAARAAQSSPRSG